MKRKINWWAVLGAVAAVTIFVVLSLQKIDTAIWFDESYSAYLIRGDFSEIWNLTAVDVHPPLYYFCLKIWSLIFGYSVVSLRMMSVFFGGVAIVLMYFLIKKLFDSKTAVAAVFFMAVTPFLIRYSEEMRMYTLVLTIVTAASLVLIWAMEKGGWWRYAIYGVLVSLGVWTHYFSVLAWIAHLVYLIYEKRKGIFKREIWGGYLVAVGLFLPWIVNFLKQFFDVSGGFWVEKVSLKTIVNYLAESFFYISDAGNVDGWLTLLLVGLVGLIIWSGIKVVKQDKKIALIVLMAIVPPVILFLLSLPPRTPLFVSRYVMYSVVFGWVLCGILILKNKGWMRWGMAILMVIVGVIGIKNVLTRAESSDVKAMLEAVVAQADDGEKIITGTESVYYDAIMYTSEQNMVIGIDEMYAYPWGSYEPIKYYQYQMIKNVNDLEDEKYWIIIDSNVELKIGEEYKIEQEFYNESRGLRAVEIIRQ